VLFYKISMIRTPLAVSHRSSRIDALHYGSVAVADPGGNIIFHANDPQYPTYLRSSIKMVQAIPVVLSGAADRFNFTEAELAVCCASHSGAGYHLSTVQGMLAKIGLDEPALGCGSHEPSDREEFTRLLCSNTVPSQLHNNCSGKHAGMLAVCVTMGWPIETYLSIEHPLQQWIYDLMADHSGIARENIGIGIDGCSLPAFYMPISGAATAVARYMDRANAGEPAQSRIVQAIMARPEMIGEHGSFDTELTAALRGRAIAKRGAMAMFVVGINTERYGPLGIAVKLEDGNITPMPVIVMRVLESIGALSEEELIALERYRSMPIKNWKGIETGEIATNFSLVASEGASAQA
jgi:L-asparaginase II